MCPVVSRMPLYFYFLSFLYYTSLIVMSFTGVFGKEFNIIWEKPAVWSYNLRMNEEKYHCSDFSSMVSLVIFRALYRIASSSHLLAKLKGLVSFSCGRLLIHLIIPVLLCSVLGLWYCFWDGLTRTAFFITFLLQKTKVMFSEDYAQALQMFFWCTAMLLRVCNVYVEFLFLLLKNWCGWCILQAHGSHHNLGDKYVQCTAR